MRKLLIALVLLAAGWLAGGCTSTETALEHGQRYLLMADLQARTLVEDWDSFWLMDRSSRLTMWHTRLGY